MNVNQILHCIPKEWKLEIKHSPSIEIEENKIKLIDNNYYDIGKIETKQFYLLLMNKYQRKPTCILKWKDELPNIIQLNNEEWKIIFNNTVYLSNIPIIQQTQCKIIHKIINL